jgi:hypothetical protein
MDVKLASLSADAADLEVIDLGAKGFCKIFPFFF